MGFRVLIVPPYYIGSGGVVSTVGQQSFTNASFVVITHNLGRFILARVILASGEEIECPVQHTINVATFTFGANLTGTIVYV